MNNKGLFCISDTVNMEKVAERIAETMGVERVDIYDIAHLSNKDMDKYNFLILGTSTWCDGELQSDWEGLCPNFDENDVKSLLTKLADSFPNA